MFGWRLHVYFIHMDLTSVKWNILTMQLLAVCIFQSKGTENEIAGKGIDVKTDNLGTAH